MDKVRKYSVVGDGVEEGEVEVGMRKREEEGDVLGWSRRGGKVRVWLRGAVEAIVAGELCSNTALGRIIFFTNVVVENPPTPLTTMIF